MSYDRADLKELVSKKHAEANNRILPMARMLAGAAPVMDKLVRTAEWERYATYLQGYLERMADQKKNALQKLGDPAIVDDQQIRKLRQDIVNARIAREKSARGMR